MGIRRPIRPGLVAVAAAVALAVSAAVPAAVLARDGRASQSGTARLAGHVVDAAGAPVAGARLMLSAAGWEIPRIATSGADGAFVVDGLPAGVLTLTASLEGYVEAELGAAAPGRPGTPVRLADGQHLTGLRVVLEAAGAISGVVHDVDGQPAAGVVAAFTGYWDGSRQQLKAAGSARSDETGAYKIGGLASGSYFVRVTAGVSVPFVSREQPSIDVPAPTWYPGVTSSLQAAPIVVAPGTEARGVDVRVALQPSTYLDVVVESPARPMSTVEMYLWAPEADVEGAGWVADMSVRPTSAAGAAEFQIPTPIPAGRYRVLVGGRDVDLIGWATELVTIDGRTPGRVSIYLQPPASLAGRVSFEGEGPAAGPPRIRLTPASDDTVPNRMRTFAAAPDASGAFEIDDIAPGRYVVDVEPNPADHAGWMLASLAISGQDALDLPIDLVPGQTLTGVEAVFSRRGAEVGGLVLDEADRPRPDATVVAFPADARYWWSGSRRIRTVRPDTSGAYAIKGLPPGNYLLAVVTDAVPEAVWDSAWLGALGATAAPVRVAAGEPLTQDLHVR